MKSKILALLLAVATLPVYSGVSGNLDISSDYFWRGASQTGGQTALSGGLQVDGNGLYGGVWASQVDFDDDANIEYDFYAGYALAVSDKISLDFSVVQYNYDDGDYDATEEVIGKLRVGPFSAMYAVDIDDSENDFVAVGMDIPFIKALDVSLEYGRHPDDSSYTQLMMSKDWKGVNIGLQILDDARHGDFMDSAALTLGWSF